LHRFELYQWADRINWDAVDRIFLVAEAKRREFLEQYPAQAHKIDVISAGVDLAKFTYQPRPFRGNIGILCHLTPRKRVYELVLTYAELLRHEPTLRLHIAGGAGAAFRDYEDALHYVVRALDLEDKVTFYGNVEDTWNWYRNIDILISNSYSEGLQVAPMEAMAMGCHVLSHNWHGADELVPTSQCYWTDSQLQAMVLEYCALPDQDKQAQALAMRELACERFDNDTKLPKIRAVISRAVQQNIPAGVEEK
jgi:glycosyltransferase involved in cell wall biosynthesis